VAGNGLHFVGGAARFEQLSAVEVPDIFSDRIFCAWRPHEGGGSFIYGCAAKCIRPSGWSIRQEIPIGDGTLISCEMPVTDAQFRDFETELASGTIQPVLLLGESAPDASVAAKRVVVQEAFGQAVARSELYLSVLEMVQSV